MRTSSVNFVASVSVVFSARVWSVSVIVALSRTVPVVAVVWIRLRTWSAVRPSGASATTLCASRSLVSRSP
ncbi:hypothetical protein V2I01_35990 [Micromonospora sp. BRA006-A]|nr:hypothetical protein [Micromonospora sp. BRA006-A]